VGGKGRGGEGRGGEGRGGKVEGRWRAYPKSRHVQ